MLTYKTSACEVCIIWRKPTETLKIHLPITESSTGKPAMVTLKIQLDCFTVHDTTLWANIFVRSHLGCGRDSVFIAFAGLTNISKTQKWCKQTGFLKIIKFDKSNSINPQNNRDLNQGILQLWFEFVDPSLKEWWVIARKSSKWGKFWLWSLIWPWRSRSITPQNNRDLN